MTEAMHQVLVVEDEPGIRRILRVMLEAEGYRVVEADTAARAESEARTHRPDLLVGEGARRSAGRSESTRSGLIEGCGRPPSA